MKTKKLTPFRALKYIAGLVIVFSIIAGGCRNKEKFVPDNNTDTTTTDTTDDNNDTTATTIMDTTIVSTFDNGSDELMPTGWSINSQDDSELEIAEVALDTLETEPDSVLHMKGTDTSGTTDWWIGTMDNTADFGLTEDHADITIQLEAYLHNSTSNLEFQWEEASDGEVWKLNFGGDANANLDPGRHTYQFTLDQFVRVEDSWASQNDSVMDVTDLNRFGIALISGNDPGNTADVYIDDIMFIEEKEQ